MSETAKQEHSGGRINMHDVWVAASAIQQQGRQPTLNAVREALGNRGSFSTIKAHLESWELRRTETDRVFNSLPAAAREALADLVWELVSHGAVTADGIAHQRAAEAEAACAAQAREFADAEAGFIAERDGMVAKVREQEDALAQSELARQADRLAAEETREALERTQRELDARQEELRSTQAHLNAARAETSEVKERLASESQQRQAHASAAEHLKDELAAAQGLATELKAQLRLKEDALQRTSDLLSAANDEIQDLRKEQVALRKQAYEQRETLSVTAAEKAIYEKALRDAEAKLAKQTELHAAQVERLWAESSAKERLLLERAEAAQRTTTEENTASGA